MSSYPLHVLVNWCDPQSWNLWQLNIVEPYWILPRCSNQMFRSRFQVLLDKWGNPCKPSVELWAQDLVSCRTAVSHHLHFARLLDCSHATHKGGGRPSDHAKSKNDMAVWRPKFFITCQCLSRGPDEDRMDRMDRIGVKHGQVVTSHGI